MASKYGSMKKAFATPGMQEGEKEALSAIAKNRGVSMKKAAAIGKRRTAKGLNTAGVKGPKGMGPHDRKVAAGDAKPKRPAKPKDPTNGRGTKKPETAIDRSLAIPEEYLHRGKPKYSPPPGKTKQTLPSSGRNRKAAM